MKIILANPRGFCAGVNMAISSLQRALELFGSPLYVFHEIVHNRLVVDSFRGRGVIFVNDLSEVPVGSRLLFSAHGVSPEIRRQAAARRLETIDATCPLVKKVHLEAARFGEKGYTILLIGHADHDEIVGTMGEAPDNIRLIETVADAADVQVPDPAKVCYLTQTTLSVDDSLCISERLRQRFPDIVGPTTDDICYATQNRQEAVATLIATADVVLVLGSRNSSNSNRLAELARSQGRSSYLIDDVQEVDLSWFHRECTVLITAGASAPPEVVTRCVEFLRAEFDATVEERTVRAENVHFPLPVELRQGPLDGAVMPTVSIVFPTGSVYAPASE
jgi:4-hydroxy-3-methylbut-2-enyl diphosphate reductase